MARPTSVAQFQRITRTRPPRPSSLARWRVPQVVLRSRILFSVTRELFSTRGSSSSRPSSRSRESVPEAPSVRQRGRASGSVGGIMAVRWDVFGGAGAENRVKHGPAPITSPASGHEMFMSYWCILSRQGRQRRRSRLRGAQAGAGRPSIGEEKWATIRP